MYVRPYPNVPAYPPVMALPCGADQQVALQLLGWAHELVRDSCSQDEQANAQCRAEAARTLECLGLLVGPTAQDYLKTVARSIRAGAYEWVLMALSRLRHAWG